MAGLAQLLQTLGDVNVSALADGKSPEWNAAASEFQFVSTVSINDAGTTTDAWSAAKIIAYVSNRLDGLDYQADVLDIQIDATLDPGATPTTGDRYIITDSASLHANFGTVTGIGDNDIVEYDGADFVVIYDVSAEGEGAIVWDRDSDAWKKWTGTTWSDLTTAGESNTASNVGASGIGVFEQKTGVDLELRKLFGTNGLATSLNGSVVEVKLNFTGLATRDAIDTANDKIAYYSAAIGNEVLTDIENLLSFYVDTTPSGGGSGNCCLTATAKTADYTAQAGELVLVSTSVSNAVTVTLPSSPSANDVVGVFYENKSGSHNNHLTVAASHNIKPFAVQTLEFWTMGDFIFLQFDGSDWFVTSCSHPIKWNGIAGFGLGGSSQYRTTPSVGGTFTTGKTLTADRIYYLPLLIPAFHTLSEIALDVTTAAASSNARLGIYSANEDMPVQLILDAGEVDCSSTGTKTISISKPLMSGSYFLALTANSSSIAVSSIPNTSCLALLGTDSLERSVTHYYENRTYAALPDFRTTAVSATDSVPRVLVK